MTAADIARLAGVGRAAVSNWRRRHEDFPEPVGGTATSPSFSLREVRAWLQAQGKLKREAAGEELWQELRKAADGTRLSDVILFAGTFLLFLHREPHTWRTLSKRDDEELARELPGVLEADWFPEGRVALVRGLADLADARGVPEAFEFLRERYFELHKRRVYGTPEPVVRLVFDLVGLDGGTVFDPACGSGGFLLGGLERGAGRVLGQEADETTAAITAIRLALRTGDADIRPGDSLRRDAFPDLQADVVVTSPPFNDRNWGYEELTADPRWEYGLPPRMESELAWVQHALARTRPGGTVAMVMPPAAAGRRSGRRIRAQLLRSGVLRAVVGLPVGAVPNMAVPLSIWIMRRPAPGDPRADHVLMVAGDGEFHDRAVKAWRRFRDDPSGGYDEPGVGRAVRIIDLLDEEVDLNPARYVQRTSEKGFAAFRTELAGLLDELGRVLPALEEPDGTALSVSTFGEQAKAGLLAIRQTPLKTPFEPGDVPVLTLQDILDETAPSQRTALHDDHVLLQTGDVVLPATTRGTTPRVVQEAEHGAVLGTNLYLVRAAPEHFDPRFLAGFLHIAARAAAARSTSVSNRVDLRRAPLPRLSLDDQRRYGEAFTRLAAFEKLLTTMNESGRQFLTLAFDGLSTGALRP
ncbi:N-6 DNA methylase [Actinomadura sp. NBRC 104412]|uniref:HsdM family class I SAM-dependent methyltransferase n=1 Tax=Actinomadura sp. NBRC 104412 TaxID=3032203 RepID=UPI002556DF12|nr:N-6 DNA methylase [Actinomadura sp. NBRC 104412]